MRLFGTCLVASPPARPLQPLIDGRRGPPDEREEETPDLWHRQREEISGRHPALGQAAINLARAEGVTVLTSTRSESKLALLTERGASRVMLENGKLSEAVQDAYPDGIDGVLDIIGNSTLLDSFRVARKGSRVCVADFLGGSEPIAFDWLAYMPFGVDVNAFASLLFGTKDFPHSDIPMQEIVDRVAQGIYRVKPVKVFPFEQLPDAHRLMESNSANGKIVVVQ